MPCMLDTFCAKLIQATCTSTRVVYTIMQANYSVEKSDIYGSLQTVKRFLKKADDPFIALLS